MMRRYLWRAIVYLLLVSWALFILVPIYWAVITSFKTELDVYLGPKFIPWVDFQPTIRTWKKFFTTEWYALSRPLTNSLIVASASAFFAVVMGTMAAYALTRFHFHFGPFRNQDILFWIVSQRMMPPIVTVLAIFIILRTLNLLDTHAGLIIVYIAFNLPLAVWIMRNFFAQLPPSIEEAAMVDGASTWQIFARIVIPMTLPSLAATFLICFVFAWNEFLFALILTFHKAQTIPILIAAQHFQRGPQWWDISALALIAIAPAMAVALGLQRYLIRGLIPMER
jgi:multiple sugar transport system permease protein